jgi:hypothetical protein
MPKIARTEKERHLTAEQVQLERMPGTSIIGVKKVPSLAMIPDGNTIGRIITDIGNKDSSLVFIPDIGFFDAKIARLLQEV